MLYWSTIHFACGGLISSCLNFRARNKTFEKTKNFVDCLYDYNYSGVNDEENSDEEEAAIATETGQSKWVSQTAADQSKLVSHTDSSREAEEDLHVEVNSDEPIDLAVN